MYCLTACVRVLCKVIIVIIRRCEEEMKMKSRCCGYCPHLSLIVQSLSRKEDEENDICLFIPFCLLKHRAGSVYHLHCV